MKRQIIILGALGAIDLLCPDVQTGAHVAIAPMVLAAIISAVGSAASSSMQKGAPAQVQGGGGGINIKPTLDPNKTAMDKSKEAQLSALSPNMAFATGADSGYKAGDLSSTLTGLQGAMTPQSKMNETVQKADAGKNAGSMLNQPIDTNIPTADLDVTSIPKGPDAAGMSFDDKMQMAALAAQLGGALAGPGAPPPPGAPRGGGISMSPVFQQMTARNMYG